MDTDFRLFPDQASTVAGQIDALYFFLIALSTFFTILIAGLIVYFAIKYRRGSSADRQQGDRSTLAMELSWIFIPMVISMVIFIWGTNLYFETARPPANAMEVKVVGKQWMWKFKHPQGNREINMLHVPVGQPVKLHMISEDVIHSMFIPAFRVKADVLPGNLMRNSYTQLWFEATKAGEYHLFCAEYCGTNHSGMVGSVIVMEPADYEQWLSGGTRGDPPEVAGRKLFEQLRCDSCHLGGGESSRGPALEGVFGSNVPLASGESVLADRDYLRRSIINPAADVVAGYQNTSMPSFQGQISEEGLIDLVAYIESLSKK